MVFFCFYEIAQKTWGKVLLLRLQPTIIFIISRSDNYFFNIQSIVQ